MWNCAILTWLVIGAELVRGVARSCNWCRPGAMRADMAVLTSLARQADVPPGLVVVLDEFPVLAAADRQTYAFFHPT
jgi:hypothetical protein